MKKNTTHLIRQVISGSIAEELEIEAGDILLKINDKEIEDVFDYHYCVNDEYLELLVQKQNGEEWLLEIEKDLDEDLGIEFENGLMDEYRSCSNHCIFCFIDQMPPGMRETLYFKDDDSRLSFLQGNYVTLTNMKDHDIERIIQYHLEPINISFHTTNPKLRCEMLHNKFAGEALSKVKRLYEAGIEMNGQIVLCRGVNDGEELDRTIRDLTGYLPYLQSVSVVPVGLTKFREGLYSLEQFTDEDAKNVIDLIENWQNKIYREHNTHFIHASDEWYLLAKRELPKASKYDGYLQLENGVGMLRLLEEEIIEALEDLSGDDRKRNVSIATGLLATNSLIEYNRRILEKFPNIQIQVIPVKNEFFGEKITVSGLITGQDLEKQLTGRDLGDQLLIPCNMLRSGENVFLDDVTVEQLEHKLGIPIAAVDSSGQDYVDCIVGEKKNIEHKRRQMYEQTDCSNCGKTECR